MTKRTKDNLLLGLWALILVLALAVPAAFAQSLDEAILEWDQPSELTQEVRVYRGAPQIDGSCSAPVAGYQKIATLPADATTYTDGPFPMNTGYCWFVTAWNQDHGESEASNLVTKRIPFLAVPPAPANLRVR